MSNICSEDSCSEAIRQGHYLCRPHWEAMQRGSISKCSGCGIAYKPAAAPLCAECEKKAQEKSRSLRDNPDIDNLVGVIKSLQEHINRDHANIGADETRTRNVLINPLLEALGWDPANPELVTTEYRLRFGYRPPRADYALHPQGQQGQPIAFIEAKRMATELSSEHRDQVFNYASRRKSVKCVCLTNGDVWEFYEIFEEAPPQVVLSIRHESAYDCAVKLLPLSNWDAEDFDDLASFEDSEGYETAEEARAPIAPSVLYPKAVGLDAATAVDMGAVLAWLAISLVASFGIGYVIGFRAARPVLEGLVGQVGAIVVAFLAVAAGVLVLRFLRRFQLPWTRLWRVEGNLRKTLYWAGAAFAIGGGIGGFLGYTIGLQTAQSVYDLLAVLGTIAILIGVVLVVFAIANEKGQGRSRRYRGRSYRRRRY